MYNLFLENTKIVSKFSTQIWQMQLKSFSMTWPNYIVSNAAINMTDDVLAMQWATASVATILD